MTQNDAKKPLENSTALPARYYTDPAILEHEERSVFARSWQLVARKEQLANAGDFIVEHIGRTPILLVRGTDGILRGFVNVCRHRGGPLAWHNGSGAKNFCCKYHGWTYDLEGQLVGAPEMRGTADFNTDGICLPSIFVEEWQGFVFASLSRSTAAFSEVYSGISDHVSSMSLWEMSFDHRESYEISCNWKLYVDNFLEGYHLPHVHPSLSKVLNYRDYHTDLYEWYSLQSSAMQDNSDGYGGNTNSDGKVMYYFIYPNIMFNITPGRLQTNRVIPIDASHCEVEFDYYYSQGTGIESDSEKDREFSDQIQREDVAICEAVQKGLASGYYDAGRLCAKRESGVWHFQNLLRDAYNAES